MSKIVIVGAGKTGRGFLARLLQEAGKEVVFIDKNQEFFVSVGGQNLKDVGVSLAKVLAQDKKYYIITAENASKPSKTLKEAIGRQDLVVSESTVFCTTIEEEGIHINSEN